jgi:hypothetical protein
VERSDKEAEGSLNNLIMSTPLKDREKLIRIGLYLIETGTIKLGGEMITEEEMEGLHYRFTYHAPSAIQTKKYEDLRQMGLELAVDITDNQPTSRERSLAITKLEECIMWANAGIARNT